jgi:hypothetical protein
MSSTAVEFKVLTYDDISKLVAKSESRDELKTACAFLLAALKRKDEINQQYAEEIDRLQERVDELEEARR